jgi:hypothetical protein
MQQLAQFNIGHMTYDLDDPRAADFLGGIDMLNRIAERSDGFVWKYETGTGVVVSDDVDDDPRILVNLTVWDNAEALRHYVWNTLHKHFLKRRAEWFRPLERAHFVMWWIPAGHRPDLAEARAKLEQLRLHGASLAAFDWDWLQSSERQQA